MLLSKHDEWGDEDRPCLNCQIRHEVERKETARGLDMLVLLGALALGIVMGIGIGVSL